MAYLQSMMRKVAQELGRSYQELLPFQKTQCRGQSRLQQNWYDSQEAVISLKDQDYEKMGIPRRLALKIMEVVGSLPVQQVPSATVIPSPGQITKAPEAPVIPEKPVRPYEDIFHNFLESLRKEASSSKQRVAESVKLLQTIVGNVVRDPYEDKYRRLKASNKKISECLTIYHSCRYILEFIGFQLTGEEYFLPYDSEDNHLRECQKWLDWSEEHVKSMYDPYQASYNSSNNMPNAVKLAESEGSQVTEYNKMLDQLIQYRTKAMSNPPLDRKTRIYHKRHQQKQVDIRQVAFEDELSTNTDPMVQQYWKQLMGINNAGFQSKRKMEFQALLKQPVYDRTLVKIRLPNEYVLQGSFAPLETISSVCDFARQYITGDIYIFMTPPVVRMEKHLTKTLMDMDCVPSGMFYLGANTHWAVRNEFLPFVEN